MSVGKCVKNSALIAPKRSHIGLVTKLQKLWTIKWQIGSNLQEK